MITFDFEYYRPDTIDEAISIFQILKREGKNPVYYAGGTEIISRARMGRLVFGAVIDLKEIPECNVLETKDKEMIIGSAVTLTGIVDSGIFPLLGKVCKASSDHTARDKITLGGNLCGITPYKEAVLPFLVSESTAVIAGTDGIRSMPIIRLFHGGLDPEQGEFLVQVKTDSDYALLPYYSGRRTKQGKIGYPLATVTALNRNHEIRVAISGIGNFPLRLPTMEKALNDNRCSCDQRIISAVNTLSGLIISDIHGSAGYRELVLSTLLSEAMDLLGG